MKKRILSLVLALCMVITLLPTVAWAADMTELYIGSNTVFSGYIYAPCMAVTGSTDVEAEEDALEAAGIAAESVIRMGADGTGAYAKTARIIASTAYTYNTPADITVNGVAAAVTFDKPSPQIAGTEIIATVTLTGEATAAAVHNIDLTSAKAGLTSSMKCLLVTAGQEMTAGNKYSFTFTMPDEAVDDLVLTHRFIKQVTYIDEGFENDAFTSNWTFVDADGDGHNWWRWTRGDLAHSGNSVILSESATMAYYDPLTPNNWLITPPILVGEDAELNFWVRGTDPYDHKDHYGVFVSTTGNAVSYFDPNTPLFAETLTEDDCLNYRKVTLDLSAYKGQVIFLAFRHYNCTNQYLLLLDDITLGTPTLYTYNTPADATVNGVTASVTFDKPSPQIADTEITATVTLTGTAAAAGTHSVDLTSTKAGLTTSPKTEDVTASQDLTATPVTKTFTFTVPAENVDDLTLTHTFKPPTPTAVFVATDSNAGTLSNVTTAMQYSVDGGTVWNDITGSSMNISGISTTNGVKVKQPGDGSTITGLASGTYYVRVKAAGTVLASDNLELTIAPYIVPAPSRDSGPSHSNYTIKASAGEGGSITSAGSSSYREGEDKSFTVTPDEGYIIFDVLVDGVSVGPMSEHKFENIQKRHTIEAIFAKGDMANFKLTGEYAGYLDVDESKWYGSEHEGAVRNATLLGIVEGDGTRFRPEDGIKLSEAIKMAAVVWNTYYGSPYGFDQTEGTHWYDTYVNFAIKYGIIKAGDFEDYEREATRAEMAYIFAHALPESELTAISNRIPPDVAATDKYADEILILYAAGVLCGNDEAGTFAGECAITRAEAAAIITRIALPAVRIAE
ncbi:MAG: choice-of-anchor J domain-containing protein [bacterium]